jgi:formate/nitrite transporter FocA (FNT family)
VVKEVKQATSPKELHGFNAYSPHEVARKVGEIGVAKVRLPFLETFMLGVLAGGFIGLGGTLLHPRDQRRRLELRREPAARRRRVLDGVYHRTPGNIFGGSLMVALVYYIIYRWRGENQSRPPAG